MNLRNLFTINAIITGLFGLGLLLATGPLTELYISRNSDKGRNI